MCLCAFCLHGCCCFRSALSRIMYFRSVWMSSSSWLVPFVFVCCSLSAFVFPFCCCVRFCSPFFFLLLLLLLLLSLFCVCFRSGPSMLFFQSVSLILSSVCCLSVCSFVCFFVGSFCVCLFVFTGLGLSPLCVVAVAQQRNGPPGVHPWLYWWGRWGGASTCSERSTPAILTMLWRQAPRGPPFLVETRGRISSVLRICVDSLPRRAASWSLRGLILSILGPRRGIWPEWPSGGLF